MQILLHVFKFNYVIIHGSVSAFNPKLMWDETPVKAAAMFPRIPSLFWAHQEFVLWAFDGSRIV